jgi:hypothetical protein
MTKRIASSRSSRSARPQASDRIKRRRRRQRQRVLSDHARLRAAADAADLVHRAVSQRLQLYRAELPATFAGGHDTLARIGELSASRCVRALLFFKIIFFNCFFLQNIEYLCECTAFCLCGNFCIICTVSNFSNSNHRTSCFVSNPFEVLFNYFT